VLTGSFQPYVEGVEDILRRPGKEAAAELKNRKWLIWRAKRQRVERDNVAGLPTVEPQRSDPISVIARHVIRDEVQIGLELSSGRRLLPNS
jgi:hypothetical protein